MQIKSEAANYRFAIQARPSEWNWKSVQHQKELEKVISESGKVYSFSLIRFSVEQLVEVIILQDYKAILKVVSPVVTGGCQIDYSLEPTAASLFLYYLSIRSLL